MDCWFIAFEMLAAGCVNIKLCVLLHESPSETLQLLEEAYGKVAMKKS
jgi:hypothetical protein